MLDSWIVKNEISKYLIKKRIQKVIFNTIITSTAKHACNSGFTMLGRRIYDRGSVKITQDKVSGYHNVSSLNRLICHKQADYEKLILVIDSTTVAKQKLPTNTYLYQTSMIDSLSLSPQL